ncbi:MAG: rhomboid family intramembrane serine protease [Verrucomicrobiota bacterium]
MIVGRGGCVYKGSVSGMVEKTFIQRQWLTVRRQVYPVLVLVVLMWVAEMADWLLPAAWTPDQWGIRSRQITGLSGVALAPFLHEGLVHLLRNTVPLLVLGWLVALSGRWLFIRVAFVTGLTSGLGAWAFGNGDAVHIGASGIVFGLLGFLIARGWVARRVGWTLLSVAVGVFYFSTVLSLLGPEPHTSWSSHFWGFTGGMGLAWWLYRHEGRRLLSGTTREALRATVSSNKVRR